LAPTEKGAAVQGIFKWGGVAASVILILFAIGSIGAGIWGIHYTRDQLKLEQIVGSPDMTPSAIKTEAQQAGLTNVDLPTCSVAGETVDTGEEAKCFASYMRVHTLEATGGQVYSEMPRFLDKNGKPTSDEAQAAKDPATGAPVANHARDLWVTYTALSTALWGSDSWSSSWAGSSGSRRPQRRRLRRRPKPERRLRLERRGGGLRAALSRGWGKSRTAVQRRR
jgi:hypothetical protein